MSWTSTLSARPERPDPRRGSGRRGSRTGVVRPRRSPDPRRRSGRRGAGGGQITPWRRPPSLGAPAARRPPRRPCRRRRRRRPTRGSTARRSAGRGRSGRGWAGRRAVPPARATASRTSSRSDSWSRLMVTLNGGGCVQHGVGRELGDDQPQHEGGVAEPSAVEEVVDEGARVGDVPDVVRPALLVRPRPGARHRKTPLGWRVTASRGEVWATSDGPTRSSSPGRRTGATPRDAVSARSSVAARSSIALAVRSATDRSAADDEGRLAGTRPPLRRCR